MLDSQFGSPDGTHARRKTRTPGRAGGRRTESRHGTRPGLEILEDRTLLSGAYPAAHFLRPAAVLPAASGTLPAGFSPAQVRHAYGFDQITFNNGTVAGDGSGQTIAIIDAYDQPNIASDLAAFDATFGIADPPSFRKANQTGGTTLPAASASWGLEISLDVEWAHAIAPKANILLVEANSSGWSDLLTAVDYARNQPGVSVVSMSFGGSEWSSESTYDSHFQTPAGHGGVTFVASTGDNGSAGAPNYPSVSPNVLAVGGTELTTDAAGNYVGETGWSGSGGGISAYYAQPAYQKGVVTQSTTKRTVPDVSYDGSSGAPFPVYDTAGYGGWVDVYGTSAGAPQWAALVAIANQGLAAAGKGALDGPSQTLPQLYQLSSADFHDITTGSNGGYAAGPGYDLVTGRGSPFANLVVADLVGNTSNPPPGQPPVVVTPASATPSPVTGTTTGLTVTASDAAGPTSLTYTWSVLAAPTGAPAPTFSVNGTNAASSSSATFYRAGNYTFQVTIRDPSGLTATSSVSLTVNQTLTQVGVTPGTATLADGSTQQFTATALDQFGNALGTQPAWTWSLAAGGIGTVSTTGLYSAPSSGSGTVTIQASTAGLTGVATVTFGAAPAAPSNLVAKLISSRQVNLTWTDNSANETGFIIQRSVNGGAWTQVAKVGANVTSYSDASVSKRKTYTYRVYAYNAFGNSAFSNVTGGVTPSVGTAAHAVTANLGLPGTTVVTVLTRLGITNVSTGKGSAVAVAAAAFSESRSAGPAATAAAHLATATPAGHSTAAEDAFWTALGNDPDGNPFLFV